jgi:hypothetical protein
MHGFQGHPGKLGVRSGRGNHAQDTKTPATGAGAFERMMRGLALVRGLPGNPHDVGSADADIGKFTVAQAIELVHAAVEAIPFADKTDKVAKHNGPLSLQTGVSPVTRLITKIAMFPRLKSNNVAPQQCRNCIA